MNRDTCSMSSEKTCQAQCITFEKVWTLGADAAALSSVGVKRDVSC